MKPNSFSCALFFSAVLLSGCSTTSQQDAAMITVVPTDSHIARMGRTHTNSDQSLTFGFPGVSFKTDVIGTNLSANLQSSTGNSWIDVVVDGGPAKAIKIPQDVTPIELFNFPVSGKHSVEIIHRSENWHGQVSLQSFSLKGEKFLPAPLLPKHKILIL